MRTLEDVWIISSGNFKEYYFKREKAIARLSDNALLDILPYGTVLELNHGYRVADFKPPKKGKKEPKPKKPKLLT